MTLLHTFVLRLRYLWVSSRFGLHVWLRLHTRTLPVTLRCHTHFTCTHTPLRCGARLRYVTTPHRTVTHALPRFALYAPRITHTVTTTLRFFHTPVGWFGRLQLQLRCVRGLHTRVTVTHTPHLDWFGLRLRIWTQLVPTRTVWFPTVYAVTHLWLRGSLPFFVADELPYGLRGCHCRLCRLHTAHTHACTRWLPHTFTTQLGLRLRLVGYVRRYFTFWLVCRLGCLTSYLPDTCGLVDLPAFVPFYICRLHTHGYSYTVYAFTCSYADVVQGYPVHGLPLYGWTVRAGCWFYAALQLWLCALLRFGLRCYAVRALRSPRLPHTRCRFTARHAVAFTVAVTLRIIRSSVGLRAFTFWLVTLDTGYRTLRVAQFTRGCAFTPARHWFACSYVSRRAVTVGLPAVAHAHLVCWLQFRLRLRSCTLRLIAARTVRLLRAPAGRCLGRAHLLPVAVVGYARVWDIYALRTRPRIYHTFSYTHCTHTRTV